MHKEIVNAIIPMNYTLSNLCSFQLLVKNWRDGKLQLLTVNNNWISNKPRFSIHLNHIRTVQWCLSNMWLVGCVLCLRNNFKRNHFPCVTRLLDIFLNSVDLLQYRSWTDKGRYEWPKLSHSVSVTTCWSWCYYNECWRSTLSSLSSS